MRLLVDECTGPAVAAWLRGQSHEVFSVYDDARGMADEDVLGKAYSENWILVTNDKDFGYFSGVSTLMLSERYLVIRAGS